MLTKLLKHEFAATARFMWIIYAALAGLSLFANLSIRMLDRPVIPDVIRILMVMILVTWGIALVAALVAALVLMLRRFHKNLLTDEGYLMFTLPTDVHHLVIAKLIVAAVWQIATMAVIALCVSLAVMSTDFLHGIFFTLREILEGITVYNAANGVLVGIECLLMLFLGCGLSMLQFYSAMSIGHGFANHKVLWSVVVYFLQSTALQILSTLFLAALSGFRFIEIYDYSGLDGIQMWHMGVLAICVAEVALGAVFYILTIWNLKNRLNLA